MSKMTDYLRGLIADANLASASPAPLPACLSPARLRSLDQPTYLRRGVVINGVSGRGSASQRNASAADCAVAAEA
jgi:hypothetical protein